MQIRLFNIFGPTIPVRSESAFWSMRIETLQWVDALRFDAPVEEGLAYLTRWLQHHRLSLAAYCDRNLYSTQHIGISFGFNVSFADEPSMMLIATNRHQHPLQLTAYLHHLDRSILPALDVLAGQLPVSIIVSGEPEASLLAAYLRLVGRGPFSPQQTAIDRWHFFREQIIQR